MSTESLAANGTAIQTIPAVVHLTWKTKRIPRSLRRYADSWSKFQDLTVRLHDDADLRDLIVRHFPEFLAQYDRFTRSIERVDFARYALMHVYGGIYADLDMECIRSVEPLLSSTRAIIGTEPIEHARHYHVDHVLCNAILLSPPGHPVWRAIMAHIVANYQPEGNVVFNTGPMAMTRLHQQRPEVYEDVEIAEPTVFYPVVDSRFGGHRDGRFDHVSREGRIADAYTVHHWVHTYIFRWPKYVVPAAIAAAAIAASIAAWRLLSH